MIIRLIQTMLLLILLAPVTAQVDYSSQIQPIFDDRCISCHGSMGGLNLTSYDNLMGGGLSGAWVVRLSTPASATISSMAYAGSEVPREGRHDAGMPAQA